MRSTWCSWRNYIIIITWSSHNLLTDCDCMCIFTSSEYLEEKKTNFCYKTVFTFWSFQIFVGVFFSTIFKFQWKQIVLLKFPSFLHKTRDPTPNLARLLKKVSSNWSIYSTCGNSFLFVEHVKSFIFNWLFHRNGFELTSSLYWVILQTSFVVL